MNLFKFGRGITHLMVWLLFRMRYEGLENIPKDKGFILASNHRTALDPLFIAHKVPQEIHYMAKIELFRHEPLGWILRHVNAFPVDRGKGDNTAIAEAKRRLESGGVLGMFIEGHRSKDGKPLRPRSGVALIAAQTGSDVLPCAVVYGKKLGFRTTVTIRYAPLIKNEALAGDLNSPAAIRAATKRIMDDIVGLTTG